MNDSPTIATRVFDALLAAGLLTVEQADSVRSSAFSEADAGRQMLERGIVTSQQLAEALEDEMGLPRLDLESYAPDEDALALVPSALARSYGVLPLFEIEGTLTIAVGEPADIFLLDAMSEQIGLALDAVLAEPEAVRDAIEQYFVEPVAEVAESEAAQDDEVEPAAEESAIDESVEEAFDDAFGGVEEEHVSIAQTVEEVVGGDAVVVGDAIDLDVLAVADDAKIAVLVADILDAAVSREANRIHLLPYKNEFFLVFRIRGRLEKVASAPLSLQQPLIEGFKTFARVGDVPPTEPAVGRIHAEIAGVPVVLGLSSVPTVAGQRLVVTLTSASREPKSLEGLGMSDAEYRAMFAMVEHGRGLMLICAPIAGGASTTYYALLQHAAGVGKAVYSVERSIDYEIPSVAQVPLGPGATAAAFLAAGMRQDTDVIAIDAIQTVEDVHIAIEAASHGKLVIATYTAGSIVAGVRRLLDIGAEPVSLASALTLGVGQRVLRTNCPNCSTGEASALMKLLPGAEGAVARKGSGCPNCGKTGYSGTAGIFEVLPFTEPVRAAIALNGSAEEIAQAASAAGMRTLLQSGAAMVRDGVVSPDELDRILRFTRG